MNAKFLHALLFSVTVFSCRELAAQTEVNSKAGTVVDCGPDKVVVFGETESKDGQYALGWTLRSRKSTQKAVDWATYDKDNVIDWFDAYGGDSLYSGEFADAPYEFLNGVIEFGTKKFTPLTTAQPYVPRRNHFGLQAEWSEDRAGSRYALINNDARWETINLWLVVIDPGGVRVVDLTGDADKAVRGILSKQHLKAQKRYMVSFTANGYIPEGKPRPDSFKAKTLAVHFDAAVPKSVDDAAVEGIVTVTLPAGTVTGVTGRKTD